MKKRNAMFLAPVAIVIAALLAVSGALALAAGTPAGGKVHLYEADTSLAGSVGTVVVTGAISDYGMDNQGVADGGAVNEIALSKGSFEINVSAAQAKVNFPVDPNKCSFSGTITAPLPIVPGSGTGAYRGITGTLEASVTQAGIQPRQANGECDNNAAPVGSLMLARASGPVSYK